MSFRSSKDKRVAVAVAVAVADIKVETLEIS